MEWKINNKSINAKNIIKKLGLEDKGATQQFFTDNVKRHSSKYVPMDTGTLSDSANIQIEADAILYFGPQARYLWYGNLMVDPITLKGAFTDGNGKFWSRPDTQKIVDPSGRKLEYKTNVNSLAGPRWVDRAWNSEQEDILNETSTFITNLWEE